MQYGLCNGTEVEIVDDYHADICVKFMRSNWIGTRWREADLAKENIQFPEQLFQLGVTKNTVTKLEKLLTEGYHKKAIKVGKIKELILLVIWKQFW